jgi:hypothetical protein
MRFLLCLFLCGCAINKPDGVYIDYKLAIKNGTVKDYCEAKGVVDLYRNGKIKLGKCGNQNEGRGE